MALALGGWSCLAGGTVLGKLSIFTGQVRNVVVHTLEKRELLWSCYYHNTTRRTKMTRSDIYIQCFYRVLVV